MKDIYLSFTLVQRKLRPAMPAMPSAISRQVAFSRGTVYIGPPKADCPAGPASVKLPNSAVREEYITTYAFPPDKIHKLFEKTDNEIRDELESDSDSNPYKTVAYPVGNTNEHLHITMTSRSYVPHEGTTYKTFSIRKKPNVLFAMLEASIEKKPYERLSGRGDLPLLTLALAEALKDISGATTAKLLPSAENIEEQIQADQAYPHPRKVKRNGLPNAPIEYTRWTIVRKNGLKIQMMPRPTERVEYALGVKFSVDYLNHILKRSPLERCENGTTARKWTYPIQETTKALHVSVMEIPQEYEAGTVPLSLEDAEKLPVPTATRAHYIIKTKVDDATFNDLLLKKKTHLLELSRRKCFAHLAGFKKFELVDNDGEPVDPKNDAIRLSEASGMDVIVENVIAEKNRFPFPQINTSLDSGGASLRNIFEAGNSESHSTTPLSNSTSSLNSLRLHRQGSAQEHRQLRPAGSNNSLSG